MEQKGSLLRLQVPETCPYPEPDESSPHPSSHFLNTHFNIILLFTPGASKLSFSLRFHHQKPVYTSLFSINATCPAHLILLNFITRTILSEEYRSLSSSLFSFLYSFVTSSFLGTNILLRTLFSDTLILCSSFYVTV